MSDESGRNRKNFDSVGSYTVSDPMVDDGVDDGAIRGILSLGALAAFALALVIML